MSTVKNIWNDFKTFKFGLFFSLCLTMMVPAIYGAIRTFFLSNNVDVSQFDVLGQMEWFDLVNEVILAFLTIPLYSVLNKIYKKDKDDVKTYVFKLGIIVFVLYGIFSIFTYFYGSNMVDNMNVAMDIRETTYHYLRLETVAFSIGIIVSYFNVVFIVLEQKKRLYLLLAIRLVMTILSDFVLIPQYGIYGVAYSNILVSSIIGLISIVILVIRKEIRFVWFRKKDTELIKDWTKTGLCSGAQSFLDNFIYIVMVVKMVNMFAQQGNYWVANNFIWAWLLIPIMALSEVIRSDCKDEKSKVKQFNYYIIITATVLLWLMTIPLWSLYLSEVEQLQNHGEIFNIVLSLFGFYIAYALTIVPDNIFIGYGKTIYSFINSVVINIGYYGIMYLLFLNGRIRMDMTAVILMFGFGMVIHEVISLIEQWVFFAKDKSVEIDMAPTK